MSYPSSFTKYNPDQQSVNKDRSILQPRKLSVDLYRKFAASAGLNQSVLNELAFVSIDTVNLLMRTRNQILSFTTIQVWLADMVTQGLLVPMTDETLGDYWQKTPLWKSLNAIAAVRLESVAKIEELKKKGHTT